MALRRLHLRFKKLLLCDYCIQKIDNFYGGYCFTVAPTVSLTVSVIGAISSVLNTQSRGDTPAAQEWKEGRHKHGNIGGQLAVNRPSTYTMRSRGTDDQHPRGTMLR